jgi:hypothetical protein
MDAYAIDALLRDYIAEVLRVLENPHRPNLIPAPDAERRATACRIRESMESEEFDRLQDTS